LSDQEYASVDVLEPINGVGAHGMTEAELSEAKSYGRLELACALADKAIDAYCALLPDVADAAASAKAATRDFRHSLGL